MTTATRTADLSRATVICVSTYIKGSFTTTQWNKDEMSQTSWEQQLRNLPTSIEDAPTAGELNWIKTAVLEDGTFINLPLPAHLRAHVPH